MEGLEPPRLAALEPKSSASTSSATPASESKLLLPNNLPHKKFLFRSKSITLSPEIQAFI